jgi:hypothetical protein
MKIWTSNEKGDDSIIAFINNIIYRGNPKPGEIETVLHSLQKEMVPEKNFTGIPISYIKEITMQEGKPVIEILFGSDSAEQFTINDDNRRNEIFDYFKANIPNTSYSTDQYSLLRAGKKPLIAMAVIAGLFIWSYTIASGMEEGNEYEVSGGNYRSVAGIVLAIASLGVKNLLLIFGSLFAIALFTFIKKTKHPVIINRIIINR